MRKWFIHKRAASLFSNIDYYAITEKSTEGNPKWDIARVYLEEEAKHLFELKTRFQQNEDKSFEQLYNEKASIFSEFGKIVCISVGFVRETTTGKQLRMKSFYHDDEETLLNQFKKLRQRIKKNTLNN